MVEFLDGPAAGVSLSLRRAPDYLRLVHAPRRKEPWDALDQLYDKPEPHERLVAYRRVGEARPIHILMSPRSKSGWYERAKYRVVADQPDDATMREFETWKQWCYAERMRERKADADRTQDDPGVQGTARQGEGAVEGRSGDDQGPAGRAGGGEALVEET